MRTLILDQDRRFSESWRKAASTGGDCLRWGVGGRIGKNLRHVGETDPSPSSDSQTGSCSVVEASPSSPCCSPWPPIRSAYSAGIGHPRYFRGQPGHVCRPGGRHRDPRHLAGDRLGIRLRGRTRRPEAHGKRQALRQDRDPGRSLAGRGNFSPVAASVNERAGDAGSAGGSGMAGRDAAMVLCTGSESW